MNIKKGIRLIAIGFLFTLININVTVNEHVINFMPDFVGWILIGIACTKLDDYVKGKPFYMIGAILLGICNLAIALVTLFLPKMDITIYKTGVSVLTIIYVFALLTLIEKIGKDKGYKDAGSIRILKYVYLIVFILFQAMTFAASYLPVNVLAFIVSISGLTALVTAIITAVVLFRMSILMED